MTAFLINTKNKMNEAIQEIKLHDRIAHDTETMGPIGNKAISGLYPFHGSRSFSHIIATKNDEFYFDFNIGGINKKYAPMLNEIFSDKERLVFYVNAIFDQMISHFDGIKIDSRVADCASLARVEYNLHLKERGDESFLGMDYLSEHYKVPRKLDIVKKYIQENNLYSEKKCLFTGEKIPLYNRVPLEIMFEYGCQDARTTFELGNKIIACINYKDEFHKKTMGHDAPTMISVAQREIKLAQPLFDMKLNGVKIWNEYTHQAIEHETMISKSAQKELFEVYGEFNISSGKEVAELLLKNKIDVPKNKPTKKGLEKIEEYKLKISAIQRQINNDPLTEKQITKLKKEIAKTQASLDKKLEGTYKTDKKTIEKIIKENAHLEDLRKITVAKEADKKISTYYKNFLLLRDSSYILHADINPNTTKTGRTSSSNPNLQNLEKHYVDINCPNSYAVRKSIAATKAGYCLIMGDYEQQEMIVMLDQAGETGIIEKLNSGEYEDFYLATASFLKETLGIEISRHEAKQMALGLAYGKGLEKLAYELGYIGANPTLEEIEIGKQKVKAFKDKFFEALPKLKLLVHSLEEQVRRFGRIHTAFGRVIYIDKNDAYKALNAYVQGTSADISKQAMINCHARLKAENMKTSLVLMVHDELIFETPFNEEGLKARKIIEEEMVKAYNGKHLKLKVGFDKSEINEQGFSTWGEKTEWALVA